MMQLSDFLERLRLAEKSKTLYIKGCIGAPMTAANKRRYTANNAYNQKPARVAMINACSADVFGFDCVCLIKAALGLWSADVNKSYGGTQVNKESKGVSYGPDHVPDVGADGIVKYLQDVSSDFSHIEVGEVVWKSGHVGVYVGVGQVIECSPSWENGVQYTNVKNLGYQEGHSRKWLKHGKLPWVDYNNQSGQEKPKNETMSGNGEVIYHIVKRGETLGKIAQKYGTTVKVILGMNPAIVDPNKIYVNQKIRVK